MNTETWLCGPPTAKGQKQQYPSRFLFNVKRYYPAMLGANALHMFSGAREEGVTTDFRKETGADYICSYEAISDDTFDAIIADPPYADHYQNEWHGELPKPKRILGEAARLVKEGGFIGILHIIVIPAYKIFGVKRVAIHPILAGPNNAVRVFNVFRKE